MHKDSVQELLANDDVIYATTQIFDALSDFTRFQIIGALIQGEKTVSELIEVSKVSQSAISHQLRLLRDRGVVSAERKGRNLVYTICDEHISALMAVGLAHAYHLAGGTSHHPGGLFKKVEALVLELDDARDE